MKDTDKVAVEKVEDGEDIFIFHDPEELESCWDWDMDIITVEEARERGANGCSKCFGELDGVLYNAPHPNNVVVL